MKVVREDVGGQRKVGLVDDEGRLIRVFVQRTKSLDYGDVVEAVIQRHVPRLGGYFAQTLLLKETVFVRTKLSYSDGETVRVQITKEARRGKEATGKLTELEPRKAPDPSDFLARSHNVLSEDRWDDYHLDEQLEAALVPEMILPNKMRLLFGKTDMCETIDVDSAGADEPFEKLNAVAAREVCRQIFLRNLSGIILIDFIGQKRAPQRKALEECLLPLLSADSRLVRYGWTPAGLFEIVRQRTTASLADRFLDEKGNEKPIATFYKILKRLIKKPVPCPIVEASPAVAALLEKEHLAIDIRLAFNCEPGHFMIVRKDLV